VADAPANLKGSSVPVSARGARADAVARVLLMITLLGVALQFALAGYAAFGAGFELHVTIGRLLGTFTLLPAVAVLLARPGRRDVILAIVLFVLAFLVQGVLAALGRDGSALFGALHAIDGMIIGGLASTLLAGATARQKQRAA
jgi:uncharacterized membrane protein YqaE (UPF0057 family)